VLSADNDHESAVKLAGEKGIVYDPNNPDHERFNRGIFHAKQTAKAVSGKVSIPKFTAEERARFPKCSDWLDRHLIDEQTRLNEVKEVCYAV
jgi:hypothetical protein